MSWQISAIFGKLRALTDWFVVSGALFKQLCFRKEQHTFLESIEIIGFYFSRLSNLLFIILNQSLGSLILGRWADSRSSSTSSSRSAGTSSCSGSSSRGARSGGTSSRSACSSRSGSSRPRSSSSTGRSICIRIRIRRRCTRRRASRSGWTSSSSKGPPHIRAGQCGAAQKSHCKHKDIF